MMRPFELIEHTADIGVRAFGSSELEVFENAAAGMFSLIADPELVECRDEFDVRAEADDREALLVEWLNELLYLHESQDLLLRRFEVKKLGETELEARVCGEPIDRGRHELMRDIKAATYHMLKLKESSEGWTTEVIFDV
ncbi:MAG: archease [Thermoleophilia bacterium]